MTGITSSISNLINSIFDIIAGIFNTLLSGIQGIFAVTGTLVQDVVGLAKGLVEFLLNNIIIIGVLIAVAVGYSAYQQKHGNTVASKKTI